MSVRRASVSSGEDDYDAGDDLFGPEYDDDYDIPSVMPQSVGPQQSQEEEEEEEEVRVLIRRLKTQVPLLLLLCVLPKVNMRGIDPKQVKCCH